jgi:hypothetical protein
MPAQRLRAIAENRVERQQTGVSLSGCLLRKNRRDQQQRQKNDGRSLDSVHGFLQACSEFKFQLVFLANYQAKV